MNIELSCKSKYNLAIIVILIGIICGISTNNNPNILIERLFKPINIGTVIIYYAGLIVMLLIYYGLKEIYKQNNAKWLSTTFRRIIVMLLIMSICPNGSNSWKIYKRFSKNLNSIYCYRDNMEFQINSIDDNKIKVICTVEIQNCSLKEQEFYIKVDVPKFLRKNFNDVVLDTFDNVNLQCSTNYEAQNSNEIYKLKGREKRKFEIIFIADNSRQGTCSGSTKSFEFALYNNVQEVKFYQKYIDNY